MAEFFSSGDKIESLQNIAIRVVEEQKKQLDIENGPKERTVFILGSTGVGKTSIINKFFDNEESPRPTLALDYSYGKRSSSGLHKQIFHVWELGGLENSDELIEVPLNSCHNLRNFSLIIILDLTEPNHIWSDLSRAIKSVQNAFTKIVENDSILATYNEKAKDRISSEHPDADSLNLFPLPLVIVGGKYDIFQDFDPEVKKQICIFLRSASHSLGAALLFHSQKIPMLSKTMRDTLSHLGFGSPSHPFRKTAVDYNESLIIWFGMDSWSKINIPPTKLEIISLNFSNKFPQVNKNLKALPDDPAKDSGFKEILIDEMRAQKDEELSSLLKETAIRAKFEIIGL